MIINPFKHSALNYLNQWYITDRYFMKEMSAAHESASLGDTYRRLAIKYMVARNFHIKNLKERKDLLENFWNDIAAVVCDAESYQDFSKKEDVNLLAKSLGKYTKSTEANLISAATKFLWFKGHHNVRIYDKRAVKALNYIRKGTKKKSFRVDGDYIAFVAEWNEQFKKNLPKINQAVNELKTVLEWSVIPIEDHELALKVSKQHWFKERILDKYLWTQGETKKIEKP